MNATIEELLRLAKEDPLPAEHTSSQWRLYGENTSVGRQDDDLVLRSFGFGGTASKKNLFARSARILERLSYRSATAQLDSYSAVLDSAKRLARDLSFDLTFNVWAQTMAMSVLMDHWQNHSLVPRVFAVIGDGHGFLGALIKRHFPESRIYQIDLPKILVFQAHTHEVAGSGTMVSLTSPENWVDAEGVFFVAPQHAGLIPENIDCAINIASMGEMLKSSIASYFTFLRRRSSPDSHFYCVNRLEKELPGGEITRFEDYPWGRDDTVFIDEPCPYYTHLISSWRSRNGPRVLGVRVPFINNFIGMTMHRLVHLAPSTDSSSDLAE